MPRFYVRPEDIDHGRFVLRGDETHHIQHVLRKKPGDIISIFDGHHGSFEARIESLDVDRLAGIILKPIRTAALPRVILELFQAVPRGQKMDYIIEKATEIGVSSITPVICERCVTKISYKNNLTKHDRWKRIARSAAQQCGRNDLPAIGPVRSFADTFTGDNRSIFRLMLHEKEHAIPLKKALRMGLSDKPVVQIWVGPEGGFSLHEISCAQVHDVHAVSLGRRILRTETAGLIAAALIQYELDLL